MSYQAPPPQFQGGMQPQFRRDIDFGVISEAFQLLTQNWLPYTAAGLVIFVANLPSTIISFAPLVAVLSNPSASPQNDVSLTIIQLALAIPVGLIKIFVSAGVIRFTLNLIQGLPATTSDIWEGFRGFPGYFATSFLSGLVTLLGVFACCIGMYVTAGLMMFAMPCKVATGRRATEAVSESWNLLKGQWFMAAVFSFVIALISGLGVFACGIGQAFTFSFMYIAATLLYCRFTGIGYQMPNAPISPYPRGQQGGGQPYGTPPPQAPEQPSQPPRPDDLQQ